MLSVYLIWFFFELNGAHLELQVLTHSVPTRRSSDLRGMNGWIIFDKPVGLGSTQAVGAVKRVCREAGLGKVKVGHGGTLDPLASGVLPIALGEATKDRKSTRLNSSH